MKFKLKSASSCSSLSPFRTNLLKIYLDIPGWINIMRQNRGTFKHTYLHHFTKLWFKVTTQYYVGTFILRLEYRFQCVNLSTAVEIFHKVRVYDSLRNGWILTEYNVHGAAMHRSQILWTFDDLVNSHIIIIIIIIINFAIKFND